MLSERIKELETFKTNVITNKSHVTVYMTDGGEQETFKLMSESVNGKEPLVVLDIPNEGYYDDDIPLLVEIVLKLVSEQKEFIPAIYERLRDVCYEFNGMKRTIEILEKEEDLAHGIVMGTDGRLKDDLVEGD